MYTIAVWHNVFGRCMAELFLDGKREFFQDMKTNCLEYAEAKACLMWPQAARVNGIIITQDIVLADNDLVEN